MREMVRHFVTKAVRPRLMADQERREHDASSDP